MMVRETNVTNISLCLSDDGKRNLRANVSDTGQPWIYQVGLQLIWLKRGRQRDRRMLHHAVRDVPRLAEDTSESNAREDVHVVALTGFELLARIVYRGERSARSEDDFAVCPIVAEPLRYDHSDSLRITTHHCTAGSKSTSQSLAGFERGKMMGRLLIRAIVFTTSSVKAFWMLR
jgi:hypothetical protein